jgi:hypothetical protein
MVNLGANVTDRITGFSGIAIARTEYLYGCVRVCVEHGKLRDGKPIEGQWFDEQRLSATSKAKSGGPGAVAPSRDPVR